MDQLHLYNTLTHQKEVFSPLDSGHGRLYVCGPTVYDTAHIDNARPRDTVFDVLYRMPKRNYPQVTYVCNITDIDDKIIEAAQARQISIDTLTQETTQKFQEDMGALNLLPPDEQP